MPANIIRFLESCNLFTIPERITTINYHKLLHRKLLKLNSSTENLSGCWCTKVFCNQGDSFLFNLFLSYIFPQGSSGRRKTVTMRDKIIKIVSFEAFQKFSESGNKFSAFFIPSSAVGFFLLLNPWDHCTWKWFFSGSSLSNKLLILLLFD